jgi:4-hydroxybenzoate polyprenyltransferase
MNDQPPRPTLRDLVRTLRPNQWTKNGVVLAAFFFALWDRSQHLDFGTGLSRVVPAAILFCLVSSGIYILNDVLDAPADRRHPTKRYRPIAAGRVTPSLGIRLALILLAASLSAAWYLSPKFAGAASAYVVIQLFYSSLLKRIALVDVLVIAAGFVLRALAGALVLDVDISPWLLLCAFLLALFLALCKRRHEKIVTNTGALSRESLGQYDERLLDQLIAVIAAATIVSYAIYTLSPATIEKFKTQRLGFTIPFVIFGIFRYLDLAYRHEKGDRPEKILLTDIPILVNLALYALCAAAVFVLHR